MSSVKIYNKSAHALAAEISSRSLSPIQVLESFTQRISQTNSRLNALVNHDQIAATTTIPRTKPADQGALSGVPVVIKDNIAVKGMRLSCGSKILGDYVSPYDAHVVERLLSAGAVVIGKSNLDEFAMGSSNESSSFGPTKNPWDQTRVPGGSSGGSAAAVSARYAPISLGSDTGGSIRQPASFCGIVGFKPTYGRVSRYGLVAYGSSLDQIGPMTNSVKDAALVFDVISGHDPRDSTCLDTPPSRSLLEIGSRTDLAGIRIGVIRELTGDGVQPDVLNSLNLASKVLHRLGATIEEVSIPSLKHCVAAYYILATAEASANLARFDGIRYGQRISDPGSSLSDLYRKSRSQGFGAEVKKRIMLGTFVLSSGYYDAYYAKAMAVRQRIALDFTEVFQKYDALLSPTAPTTAYRIGEKVDDPLSMYLGDICTIGANLAGIPALSVPSGFDASGLPIGIQLIGPRLKDEFILRLGHLYELARGDLEKTPEGIT